jgi:tetratricopeptide (TPR) repeat protein
MITKGQRIFIPVLSIIALTFRDASSGGPFVYGKSQASSPLLQIVQDAKAKLRAGVNRRDPESCRAARDLFIRALLEAKTNQAYFDYYVGLADYRLATFAFVSGDRTEAGRAITEGKQYLELATAADPAFGESFALYGYLLGLEIGLNPDLAMSLGMKSTQYLGQAEEKEPANPRVHLLKGIYWLYVPEAYGGGPDTAIASLVKAEALFAKETAADPMKPDWGKDEAYMYLGLAFKQKNDLVKARAMFEKTLVINPDFGWARSELAALDKK